MGALAPPTVLTPPKRACDPLGRNATASSTKLSPYWEARLSRIVDRTLKKLGFIAQTTARMVPHPEHEYVNCKEDPTALVRHTTSSQGNPPDVGPAEKPVARCTERVTAAFNGPKNALDDGVKTQGYIGHDQHADSKKHGRRFHHKRRPPRCPPLSTRAPNRSTVLRLMLQREHYSGDFIGGKRRQRGACCSTDHDPKPASSSSTAFTTTTHTQATYILDRAGCDTTGTATRLRHSTSPRPRQTRPGGQLAPPLHIHHACRPNDLDQH